MVRFIIYLFETGLCLSLLYLAYWLLLREETYFNFNRIFLVGSLLIALSAPLLHLHFIIPQGSSFWDPAERIVEFQNYYEELILMSDADFGSEPGRRHRTGSNTDESGIGEEGVMPTENLSGTLPDSFDSLDDSIGKAGAGHRISVAMILLIIYICGVMYFLTRFIYLVVRLYLLANRNGIARQKDFRIVEIKEEISPFSFFRFLFINFGYFNESELQNVLEHEKAHIRQKHSMDHLFAHGLAVFQWFNPFAWQIRKALKTTHEYIADRQVIAKGYKLFDYQSLLLKQVIGYHSVELVNNFNLKPIKKRIAMMSKTRSGIPAKLKALLVIPFTIVIFLVFADFTLRGPGNKYLDLNSGLPGNKSMKALTGLWESYNEIPDNMVHDPFGLIYISEDKFSYVEGGAEVREYFWRLEKGNLVLSTRKDAPGTNLKIKFDEKELNIWWNDNQYHTYRKTDESNTLDVTLKSLDVKIDPVEISQYRILEKQHMTYGISLGYRNDGSVGLLFNTQSVEIDDLAPMIEEYRSTLNKLDQPKLTAMFRVDKNMPMGEVVKVKERLRKINSLKIADAGYPDGEDVTVSPLLYHMVGLPRLLPPTDAETIDKEEIGKMGIELFEIDLGDRNTTPADIERDLERFIRLNDGGKYIFSMEYDQEIPYGEYIEAVEIVWTVVYRFRQEMAMGKFQAPYSQLGDALQKEIKKAYPIALSETGVVYKKQNR